MGRRMTAAQARKNAKTERDIARGAQDSLDGKARGFGAGSSRRSDRQTRDASDKAAGYWDRVAAAADANGGTVDLGDVPL